MHLRCGFGSDLKRSSVRGLEHQHLSGSPGRDHPVLQENES
jgi:hypothetical protein